MGWTSSTTKDSDRGANLVEFAFVMPLLLLLILGIIEFGWLLGLNNDIRHGAREGARFAAVDGGNNASIHQYVCNAMEPLGGSGIQTLEVELSLSDTNGISGIQIGDTGTLEVNGEVSSLSGVGFIELFLPDSLSSTIDFRLEQDPSWGNDGGLVTVSC